MQLIFIRHGEKTRHSDSPHLNRTGYIRAETLPGYLLHPYNDFRKPTKAYIMYREKVGKSERCFETMLPTIEQSDMVVEMVSRHGTYNLANHLLTLNGLDKTYLICWQHSRIVDMVKILGANVKSWGLNPEADYDDKDCFNATWVCDLTYNRLVLTVYRQFDIVDDEPVYLYPRNDIWFQKEYIIDNKQMCTIC